MGVMMKAPRNYTLRTTSGHTIHFKVNQPTMVPDDVVAQAMALNIIPVETSDLKNIDESGKGIPNVVITGILRDALAIRTIEELVKENDTTNFDGGNRPKVNVINERSGLALTATERNAYWEKFRELQSTGEDAPTHKNLETVIDVQAARSSADMKNHAILLDIKPEVLDGKSLREQKMILLQAAIKS